ncbi:alpha/beta fold hydrolase [Denitratisoma oestradiolicum]|uniref:Alpha/beta hydrolase n=1 Tax=Denitratisoma oestradiolicum TaxID=311182 RepID=A0A6S6XX46_9PROT|nr:alpha/beta hydrolase [Denitratisoma oestradiolicum]TWO81469.1 alpha/beta hydrolase [Denitratisoma oestradiolicum]CAB1368677.1 Alpha/beta hydrolase [Denitratisoma oestradiolicum]
MQQSTSEFLQLRGRRIHVRLWGETDAPLLFLLHGWCEVSASFQFVVEAFQRSWRVIAPDWRGFGLSQWNDGHYWFPDYFADLDALLQHYSPDAPARIVGHSMGAVVSSIYGGACPERVSALVNMEGVGLQVPTPEDMPGRLAQWIRQSGREASFRTYPDRTAFAARLRRDNPRLSADRAEYLARHLARDVEGGVRWAADPCHLWVNPVRLQLAEAMACWRRIEAPVLFIHGADSVYIREAFGSRPEEMDRRLACFARHRVETLADCGHNLHHDQPEQVAALIEGFLP